jgi:hypothetical protein
MVEEQLQEELAEVVEKTPEQILFENNMALALGDLPQETQSVEQQPEVVVEQKTETSKELPSFDVNNYIKEKFGFENEEAALAEITALKNAKEEKALAELRFANEEMKKIYEYAANGKEEELQEYFSKRSVIKNIENKTPDEKLKLYIKLQNPLFDEELIEDEYKSLYEVDEESSKFLDEEYNVDKIKLKKEKIRVQQRIATDVELANKFFEQYKTKIDLPSITKDDEDYEAYKASISNQSKVQSEVIEAYSKFKPEDISFKTKFVDEANKQSFDLSYSADKESFEEVQKLVCNDELYYKQYFNEDGSPNRSKFIRDVYIAKNFEKIAQQIALQTKNEVMRWYVNKETSNNGGMVFLPEQQNDFQKKMEMAFSM